MLTCGVIGTAHPWVAGTSTSKEYTFRCPYKKSSGSVTTYNVWTTSIEASRIELCSVWASISTPGGKTEAELQQIHWPCVAPDTELQKVANPLYIGPNNGMSTTSTTTTTNPTVCRYEISG